MADVPIVREVDNRIEVEWPTPLAGDYPVSVELIRQWVNQENQRREFGAALSAIKRISNNANGLNGHGNLRLALASIDEITRAVLGERPEAWVHTDSIGDR